MIEIHGYKWLKHANKKKKRSTHALPVPHHMFPPVHNTEKQRHTFTTFHNIAAHEWITIRHLCVRLEKKSFYSSKRIVCLIYFGIISFRLYTQTLKASTFSPHLKHFFFFWENIWLIFFVSFCFFAPQNMQDYNVETTFLLREIGYIQSNGFLQCKPLPTYVYYGENINRGSSLCKARQ